MWILILEALLALGLLVFIVWWTMSGRRENEAPASDPSDPSDASDASDPEDRPKR